MTHAGEATTDPAAGEGWRPRVSIIVLTYNKLEYTQQCLAALAATTPGDLYELIIVDNASVDGTRPFLDLLQGDVQVLLNDTNRGFVEGCNQGARLARGDYLLLLNNDAIPQPGWLEPLLALADADPRVGVVGAQLVYPDGRLQEAGCILWQDATGWNVGKDGHPDDPRYTFVREVDYCSGAALLIRRAAWEAVGGFDRALAPAYYEDADLCFAIRAAGWRVVYQPGSVVAHHEGATNGTDLGGGIKRYQRINRDKFRAKWAAELTQRLPPPEGARRQALMGPVPADALVYACNVCGQPCATPRGALDRDMFSCPTCLSHPRARAIIHVLSTELFGESLALPAFPLDPTIRGLGMSDMETYAQPLARRLATSIFYNRAPRLDITDIDPALAGAFDFVICADVMEHVPPPTGPAFANLRRLLKDDGVLVFTVPYRSLPWTETEEHFPDLHDFDIVQRDGGGYRLHNTTATGLRQTFDDLVFHGGEGLTLEMRVFAEAALLRDLREAGFTDVRVRPAAPALRRVVAQLGLARLAPDRCPAVRRLMHGRRPAGGWRLTPPPGPVAHAAVLSLA
ncbi:MAG: glycosyltransferase [Dehalococcoidia bacterium]